MVDLDTIKEMRKLDELEIADLGERNKALLIEFDELKKNLKKLFFLLLLNILAMLVRKKFLL